MILELHGLFSPALFLACFLGVRGIEICAARFAIFPKKKDYGVQQIASTKLAFLAVTPVSRR
jgi:hypothetical protein